MTIFSKISVTRDVTARSFQSMAKVCVAECDGKLKISYVKGGTRVGVGSPTDGGEVIYIGNKSQWQPETLV